MFGGRWNSPRRRVVYTADTAALALLEMMVHSESGLLRSYKLIPVSFNEAQVIDVGIDDLPGEWRAFPAPHGLKVIGDTWLENKSSLVLRVPSAIVPVERNYLLNPNHPDFPSLAIGEPQSFDLDLRLL